MKGSTKSFRQVGNLRGNIQRADTMQNGSKRQGFVKGLTTNRPKPMPRGGNVLKTLPSNPSVRKGKMSVGTQGKPAMARTNVAKANATHRMMTKNPNGAGGGIKTLGSDATVQKGRMNVGTPARRGGSTK